MTHPLRGSCVVGCPMFGRCHDGCEAATPIASRSCRRDGLVRGMPGVFLRGHNLRHMFQPQLPFAPFDDENEADPRFDSPLGNAIRALLEVIDKVHAKAPRSEIIRTANVGLAEATGAVA